VDFADQQMDDYCVYQAREQVQEYSSGPISIQNGAYASKLQANYQTLIIGLVAKVARASLA